MASQLQDSLSRIVNKSAIMMEKYRQLLSRNETMSQQLEEQQALVVSLREQVEQLQRENEYLKLAHTLAPTPESIAHGRKVIAKIVRDIDKCISQLNA